MRKLALHGLLAKVVFLAMCGFLVLASGCEPFSTVDVDEENTNLHFSQGDGSQGGDVAAPDTPATAGSGGFLWEPRGDSIRVVIPADLAHWQFHIFSRWSHQTLYGPDNRAGNQNEAVEYILQGGPERWRSASLSVDPTAGGSLLVYINTRDMQATGHASAGWRIIDPAQRQEGDADRLQPGQDK